MQLPSAATLTILVADDDHDMQAITRAAFEYRGHRVIATSNGGDALDAAVTHVPDVVILDLLLAGLTGWEVALELRSSLRTADTAMLAVTGLITAADRHAAYACGFDDFVNKPVSPTELIRRVETLAMTDPRVRAQVRKSNAESGERKNLHQGVAFEGKHDRVSNVRA
jgi:two-component system KDP operon response regulator KdpE